MAAPPSICTQITIDDTNKYIDCHDGVDEDTATITTGTYADIWALCSEIQTRVRLLDAGASPYGGTTVVPNFDGSVPGLIKFTFAATCAINWKTGTHGSDNTDTHIGTILGFDDSEDDSGASTYTSDYQHQHGFYCVRWPKSYGPEKREAIGGDLRVSLSSQYAKKVHVGFRRNYRIELVELVPELTFVADATGSNTNRDLETVWQAIAQGDYFRYREDQEVEGTYTDYYLKSPHNFDEAVTRPHMDYESYNITLDFIRKES